MAINRYQTSTPYEGQLYTPPLELLGKAMELSQQRYDKNLANAEELKAVQIESLPQDRQRADALQTKYNKAVDDVVAKYHGDLSQAGNDLTRLNYQIKKDFSPGGEAHAITTNYSNYKNWLKESQDLVEKGKALGEDFNLSNQYHMNNYTGIGEKDPVTGSYKYFQPETLSEYVNPDDIIQDVYKNFKPQKYEIGRTVFENGQQKHLTDTFEGISPDRLYPSFATALAGNPKFNAYIQQRSRYTGVPQSRMIEDIDKYTQQRAQDLAYLNESHIDKSERDPLFLLRERQRLKDQSNNSMLNQLRAQYQYDPTTEATTRKEASLDPDNWKKSAGIYTDMKLSGAPAGGGLFPSTSMGSINPKYNNLSFADALKDPDFIAKTNTNKQFAETILQDKKEEFIQSLTTKNVSRKEAESRFDKLYKDPT